MYQAGDPCHQSTTSEFGKKGFVGNNSNCECANVDFLGLQSKTRQCGHGILSLKEGQQTKCLDTEFKARHLTYTISTYY
jgi:hypothetical protein